jgi:hypothetical protein
VPWPPLCIIYTWFVEPVASPGIATLYIMQHSRQRCNQPPRPPHTQSYQDRGSTSINPHTIPPTPSLPLLVPLKLNHIKAEAAPQSIAHIITPPLPHPPRPPHTQSYQGRGSTSINRSYHPPHPLPHPPPPPPHPPPNSSPQGHLTTPQAAPWAPHPAAHTAQDAQREDGAGRQAGRERRRGGEGKGGGDMSMFRPKPTEASACSMHTCPSTNRTQHAHLPLYESYAACTPAPLRIVRSMHTCPSTNHTQCWVGRSQSLDAPHRRLCPPWNRGLAGKRG